MIGAKHYNKNEMGLLYHVTHGRVNQIFLGELYEIRFKLIESDVKRRIDYVASRRCSTMFGYRPRSPSKRFNKLSRKNNNYANS